MTPSTAPAFIQCIPYLPARLSQLETLYELLRTTPCEFDFFTYLRRLNQCTVDLLDQCVHQRQSFTLRFPQVVFSFMQLYLPTKQAATLGSVCKAWSPLAKASAKNTKLRRLAGLLHQDPDSLISFYNDRTYYCTKLCFLGTSDNQQELFGVTKDKVWIWDAKSQSFFDRRVSSAEHPFHYGDVITCQENKIYILPSKSASYPQLLKRNQLRSWELKNKYSIPPVWHCNETTLNHSNDNRSDVGCMLRRGRFVTSNGNNGLEIHSELFDTQRAPTSTTCNPFADSPALCYTILDLCPHPSQFDSICILYQRHDDGWGFRIFDLEKRITSYDAALHGELYHWAYARTIVNRFVCVLWNASGDHMDNRSECLGFDFARTATPKSETIELQKLPLANDTELNTLTIWGDYLVASSSRSPLIVAALRFV